ncbi:MAG: protein-L-isoaspartate(D-aspartate) O-methyltransferase [Chloroflexi bacterium]|nr:protein-L-isoaspartate(D-aspartate) O-methyltransferase [Anaerolineaceae bacterium]NMB91009.1 protein-L-isoaspartate(D-aspartate) O-methyltransferase [Chloroflexota bacterium]
MDEAMLREQRMQMVSEQIYRRGLRDPRLLDVFRTVPRHLFVPPELQLRAYEDGPLPIGHDQTISQPFIVAIMTSLLQLEGDEKVLEVGTGSGYQAAILASLAGEIHTVEWHPGLAEEAGRRLERLGLHNVHVHQGDGSLGWPAYAPYAAILVAAAAPAPPRPLLEQLAAGGRLVIPVGARGNQQLQRWVRRPNYYEAEDVIPVSFVPLLGQHGWSGGEWMQPDYYI